MISDDEDSEKYGTLPFSKFTSSGWEVSNIKALKEIEKAVRIGLGSCKEE